MVTRPLNDSILPDTSSRAPTGIWRSRANLKNTRSANPVSSRTTTRQGWRGLAGFSWRTTSTASVATDPIRAARMVGRSRRSRYESGRWNNRSITRSPPAALAISADTAGPMPRSEVRGAKTAANGSVSTG